MLLNVIGVMGSGKTLFATNYACDYSKRHPKNKIYANYNLKLKNFFYTPFLFLPFSDLRNCLIIADDFYALQNLKQFTQVVVNLSRKRNIDLILTCQYYTMVSLQLRTLANYNVFTKYIKSKDTLLVKLTTPDGYVRKGQVSDAVMNVKEIYDTNEVVIFPTERKIKKCIKDVSKTLDDIELNLNLYSGNSRLRQRLLNEIQKEKGLD